MSDLIMKRYDHITGVFGDNGENEGALAVHVVLDPGDNYPEQGRIIVGSPRETPTIAGYIPDLGGFSCGPDAAERLAGALMRASGEVRQAMGARLPCRFCGDPTHRAEDAVCVRDDS